MHLNTVWMAWGVLLFFVAFMIRVALKIRGTWSAVRDITNSGLPLAPGIGQQVGSSSVSFNVSSTLSHAQSTGIGVTVRQPLVFELDPKTASVSDIPKAMLDLLSPEQRKLLLEKFAEAKRASADGTPSPKAPQG